MTRVTVAIVSWNTRDLLRDVPGIPRCGFA